MMVRVAAVVVAVCVVLGGAGCASSRHQDLVGAWSDSSGRLLPDGSGSTGIVVVTTFLASDRCEGPKDTVYLELSWPVGQPAEVRAPGGWDTLRFYVRGNSVEHRVSSEPFHDDVSLPAAATSTGFERAGNKISVDAAGAAYVTRPDGRTERWPRITLGCA